MPQKVLDDKKSEHYPWNWFALYGDPQYVIYSEKLSDHVPEYWTMGSGDLFTVTTVLSMAGSAVLDCFSLIKGAGSKIAREVSESALSKLLRNIVTRDGEKLGIKTAEEVLEESVGKGTVSILERTNNIRGTISKFGDEEGEVVLDFVYKTRNMDEKEAKEFFESFKNFDNTLKDMSEDDFLSLRREILGEGEDAVKAVLNMKRLTNELFSYARSTSKMIGKMPDETFEFLLEKSVLENNFESFFNNPEVRKMIVEDVEARLKKASASDIKKAIKETLGINDDVLERLTKIGERIKDSVKNSPQVRHPAVLGVVGLGVYGASFYDKRNQLLEPCGKNTICLAKNFDIIFISKYLQRDVIPLLPEVNDYYITVGDPNNKEKMYLASPCIADLEVKKEPMDCDNYLGNDKEYVRVSISKYEFNLRWNENKQKAEVEYPGGQDPLSLGEKYIFYTTIESLSKNEKLRELGIDTSSPELLTKSVNELKEKYEETKILNKLRRALRLSRMTDRDVIALSEEEYLQAWELYLDMNKLIEGLVESTEEIDEDYSNEVRQGIKENVLAYKYDNTDNTETVNFYAISVSYPNAGGAYKECEESSMWKDIGDFLSGVNEYPISRNMNRISITADKKISNEKYKDKISSEFGGYNFCYRDKGFIERNYDEISTAGSIAICGVAGLFGGPVGYCVSSLATTVASEYYRGKLESYRWPYGIGEKRFSVQ